MVAPATTVSPDATRPLIVFCWAKIAVETKVKSTSKKIRGDFEGKAELLTLHMAFKKQFIEENCFSDLRIKNEQAIY